MKTKYRPNKKQFGSSTGKITPLKKPDTVIPVKCNYKDLPEWVKTNFDEELFFTERALRSLKKAEYEDVKLVYQALKILATHYHQMRKGRISKNDFEQKCRESGLDYQKASTDVGAGMQKETYFVKYKGKRRRLDFHLTKGSRSEPRKCLRIYFFWDEDNELVVIGHLPSHLKNTKS